MNTFEQFFHRFFKFIWNAIFVLTYPVLATFGLLFIGVTYFFSFISSFLARFSRSSPAVKKESDWTMLSEDSDVLEGKLYKQIIFGPECYRLRRKDGIPSVIDDLIFGKKVKVIQEGLLLEKWNTTDIAQIPDFDICLYQPDDDKLTKLAHIRCFDWHLSEKQDDFLCLKWFDGTQGGEVKVAIA
ncbi:hypothetical protein SAMN05192553_103454 [Cyclobacterium xiamenense]|uniref:Uncharacterized protein n=1 Tax=Cyclobacterium xiamenense TaxID=1297121 RepID=A0A1H6YGN1_9BACT|nr:hypothetical protein [Cyclobacterium xiamenense]SEJ35915.1 hypothetical protein SAMN05192553_103454 [Cyclobacterium xiamenense]